MLEIRITDSSIKKIGIRIGLCDWGHVNNTHQWCCPTFLYHHNVIYINFLSVWTNRYMWCMTENIGSIIQQIKLYYFNCCKCILMPNTKQDCVHLVSYFLMFIYQLFASKKINVQKLIHL
jgi:hypothetical protein